MSAFRKLLLLSDLHLGGQAARHDRDPAEDLERVLHHVAADHADVEALFVLGDLADHGAEDEYRQLQKMLRDLPWPVHMTLGNHDLPDPYRRVFKTGPEIHQRHVLADGTPCYLLDTNVPGQPHGTLGPDQLAWLEDCLATETRPGFLFLHHPPGDVGVPAFDEIGLTDSLALQQILARHDRIRAAFFGHCHMPVALRFGTTPAFCVPSTFIQSRPVFDHVAFAADPAKGPAFGILLHNQDAFAFHELSPPPAMPSGKEPENGVC